MDRKIRPGPHCVTLLHRITGASSAELDAAIAALPPTEREQLDALAGEILNDVRDFAGVDTRSRGASPAGPPAPTKQPAPSVPPNSAGRLAVPLRRREEI